MVFIKFEGELKQLKKEINKKHQAIKFEIKSSKKNNRISRHISVHRQQQPSIKNQLTFKTFYMLNHQALRIARICSTSEEYRKNVQDVIKRFVEKSYI